MLYRYIQPSPLLKEFVRDYLVAHFVFNPGEPIPIKAYAPKPEQGITFFPKGFVSITTPDNKLQMRAPQVSVFGQQVSRYNFHLTQEYLMLRVHFHPGALYRLLGIPLAEFTDLYSDAASIINQEVDKVNDNLANCANYDEMIQLVERYLLDRVRKTRKEHYLLDDVATCMMTQPGKFSLDYFASQACLSPRQFNRKFTERMGIGPKLFNRITRFYNAYQYKQKYPNTDWLSVAFMFDYTDYQHLVKDFKEFAGLAPPAWVDEDNRSPERRLKLE